MESSKAQRIKETLAKTKHRRKGMEVHTYVLKLQNISQKKEEKLKRAFLEAKWLYNWLLEDISRLNLPLSQIKSVSVRVGNQVVERPLQVLGSQIKQEIGDRLKDNLHSLKRLKEEGHQVGPLHFKSHVDSLPFKQYGTSHYILPEKNQIHLQNLGKFRVLGLHQIPKEAEKAKANLVYRPSGYYLHLTCYLPKGYRREKKKEKRPVGELPPVGIDLGVSRKLTLSTGLGIDWEIPEHRYLKRLQQKVQKTAKGSQNRKRLKNQLRRAYEKLNNRRKDAQNRVLSFLQIYQKAAFQEDNIHSWMKLFGGSLQGTGIGEVKRRVSATLPTMWVDRFEGTTKECFQCGEKVKIPLSQRTFCCPKCGYNEDRDLNAAKNILRKGLGLAPNQPLGVDCAEVMPVESKAIARILEPNPWIRVHRIPAGSPSL